MGMYNVMYKPLMHAILKIHPLPMYNLYLKGAITEDYVFIFTSRK